MERDAQRAPEALTVSLASLSEREQRVLSYAAAMGKEFRFDVLALVTEMEEEALAEVLEGLVHRGVVRELAGGDVYVFVREETLGQAYRSISSSRLRVIHKKIAEGYEKVYSANPPQEVIAEMGRHFHLGKVAERSLLYNRYAATLARGSFSPETAKAYLERVVEDLRALPGDHRSEEVDVLREIGDLYFDLGDATRADEFYAQALSKLPEDEKVVRALLLLNRGDAARETFRIEPARQYAVESLRLLQGTNQKRGLALAHKLLSRILFMEDRPDLALKETENALALFDPETDAKDIARSYIELANAVGSSPRPEDQARQVEDLERAIAALEPLNDYHELFRAHNNLAVATGNNDPHRAIAELRAARICAEKAGNRRNVGWSLFNSAEFLLEVGQAKEAAEANDAAYEILSHLDDPLGMQQIWMNRGIIAQKSAHYEEAERAFREALVRAQDLGRFPLVAEMHLRFAILYQEWKHWADRDRELSEIRAIGEDRILPAVRPLYDDLLKTMRGGH